MKSRETLHAKMERLHGEVMGEVRELRGTVEATLKAQERINERIEGVLEGHDERLRQMEKKVWYTGGITGILALIANIKAFLVGR